MTHALSPMPGFPFTSRQVAFLIVGLARSGTTLSQRLAAEIDGVWVARETHFWSRYLHSDHRFGSRHVTRPAVRKLLSEMQRPDELIALTADEGATILARVAPEGCTPWELFANVVDSLSPDGPQTLGEKTPAHAGMATRLLAEQPALKVVAIVRDPRAIFASMLSVPWGLRDSQRLAWRWRLIYERLLADVDAFGRHRVMLVRYEDIVADPAGYQADLAAFLDVPLQVSAMKDDELFLAGETWKQRALEAPDANRIDAWREHLAAADVALIERITAPVATPLGYAPTNPAAPHLSVDPATFWRERQSAAIFDVG